MSTRSVVIRRSVLVPLVILITWQSWTVSGKPCHASDGFWFNKQPSGIGVPEGSRAFLECNVSDHCNIQFHWTLNDEIVSNSTRRYQNGSNLVITRVNRTLDSGLFHCIATMVNDGLSKESDPAELSIWWISRNASVVLASPSQSDIDSGYAKTIELTCRVNGNDDLTFSWLRNGRPLKHGGKISIEKRRLILHTVSVADNGVYSCTAENSAGLTRSQENFALTLPGTGMPKITSLPVDQLGMLGSSVIFSCRFTDVRQILWIKPNTGQVFTSQGRIRQLANDSLLLTDLRVEDEGAYECAGYGVDGSQGSQQSFVAWLNIASLDEFDSNSFEPVRDLQVVGQGKRFEVTCLPPKGFPDPIAYWTRNGERITNSGRIRVTDDMLLVIDAARIDDQGEYICVSENMAGQRRGTVRLYVSRPPTVEYHPSSLDAEEGAPAFFECKFKGNDFPVTIVEWEFDGELMKAGSRDQRIKVFTHNGTLIVESVHLTDAGDYRCVVKTGDQPPVYSRAAKLTVREKLKFVPKPVDKKVEAGNGTQIPCRATGHIAPKIRWFKAGSISLDGTVVKFAQLVSTFPENIRERNGTLYFFKTRFEDAGQYMCVAVSSQGVINETIKVEVFVYPTFKVAPRDEIVPEGEDAWFHCVVDGTPKPTVQWFHEQVAEAQWDKKKINYIHHANHSLQLRNVQIETAGSFACLAGNRGGFKRQGAVLCVVMKNSNVSNCGSQIGLVKPWNIQPGQTLEDVYRASLSDAQKKAASAAATIGGMIPMWQNRSRTKDQQGQIVAKLNDTGEVAAGGVPLNNIVIACGAAAAYLLLVVFLVSYCAYRRRKQRDAKPDSAASTQLLQQQKMQINVETTNGWGQKYQPLPNGEMVANGYSTSDQRAMASSTPRSRVSSNTASSGVERLSRDWLQFINKLGCGVYGPVYKMRARKPETTGALSVSGDEQDWTDVFVKSMTAGGEDARNAFEQEMIMYSKFEHPNIVKLVGICRDTEPIYMVMEYLSFGNLKHYLYYSKQHKGPNSSDSLVEYPPPLTAAQIVNIAHQIAQAMEYLSSHNVVHKDLAARNVLISPEYVAKITHLSLSEDQFVNEYFTYQNRRLPIRWMASEPLFDNDWSLKSDVWSFAVLMWEMYTIGELPFLNMSNEQVLETSKRRDLRLTPPPNAPVAVRDLMLSCWSENVHRRPPFTELSEELGQLCVDSGL